MSRQNDSVRVECHLPPLNNPMRCRRCMGKGFLLRKPCTRCGGLGTVTDPELWERLADAFEQVELQTP